MDVNRKFQTTIEKWIIRRDGKGWKNVTEVMGNVGKSLHANPCTEVVPGLTIYIFGYYRLAMACFSLV